MGAQLDPTKSPNARRNPTKNRTNPEREAEINGAAENEAEANDASPVANETPAASANGDATAEHHEAPPAAEPEAPVAGSVYSHAGPDTVAVTLVALLLGPS